jgi:hypothetical protein
MLDKARAGSAAPFAGKAAGSTRRQNRFGAIEGLVEQGEELWILTTGKITVDLATIEIAKGTARRTTARPQ